MASFSGCFVSVLFAVLRCSTFLTSPTPWGLLWIFSFNFPSSYTIVSGIHRLAFPAFFWILYACETRTTWMMPQSITSLLHSQAPLHLDSVAEATELPGYLGSVNWIQGISSLGSPSPIEHPGVLFSQENQPLFQDKERGIALSWHFLKLFSWSKVLGFFLIFSATKFSSAPTFWSQLDKHFFSSQTQNF